MKKFEHSIESIIRASRWLLVVSYVGLGIALALLTGPLINMPV